MYLIAVTNEKFDTIATNSGFNVYSHFYRSFTKRLGMPPSEYRQRIREDTSTLEKYLIIRLIILLILKYRK